MIGENISTLNDEVEETISENWVTVIRLDITTGIFGDSKAQTIEVYPNPARTVVNVVNDNIDSMEITSMHGLLMITGEGDQIDVSGLNSGQYLLRAITTDGSVLTQTIIVE